ncbi:hypothetical protein [Polaromonas sp.]|uniref:hypothetical protein n=1 Tax=Polaromonas sp. TaxID=1869339 RepID=UPI0025CFFA51|nr:hypothetical protein [Polaromonas sp.]
MDQGDQKPVVTAADYLAWEPAQRDRHEFLGGEVFAMAGAEDWHVTVTIIWLSPCASTSAAAPAAPI